jgi:hypothetical protein
MEPDPHVANGDFAFVEDTARRLTYLRFGEREAEEGAST